MENQKKGLTKKQIEEAIERDNPQPPVINELGGGFYYTCHWLKCNENLKTWFRYCPMCGTKIDWSGINDFFE